MFGKGRELKQAKQVFPYIFLALVHYALDFFLGNNFAQFVENDFKIVVSYRAHPLRSCFVAHRHPGMDVVPGNSRKPSEFVSELFDFPVGFELVCHVVCVGECLAKIRLSNKLSKFIMYLFPQ